MSERDGVVEVDGVGVVLIEQRPRCQESGNNGLEDLFFSLVVQKRIGDNKFQTTTKERREQSRPWSPPERGLRPVAHA